MRLIFVLSLFLAFLGQAMADAPNGDVVIKGVKKGFAPGDPSGAVEYHTGLLHREGLKKANLKPLDLTGDPACDNLPAAFDLLTDVKPSPVSAVRDQGQCGSCWDFSKTGAFESWLRVQSKGDFNLSEEEVLSNDNNNYGCNGGNLNPGEEYQSRVGQGLESDWPYTASEQRSKKIPEVGQAPDFEVVQGSGDAKVKNVQCALFKYHTVPWITVGADNDWGAPPEQDGAVWTRCSNNGTNHAIGVTGWKTVNGKVYFHAKNSWGTGWGQSGYAWIPLGCDGFGEEVAFLPATPAPPPPTCDGQPIGSVKDLGCPAGQTGEHKQTCDAAGKWDDTVNTCTAPTPPPPPPPQPGSLPSWIWLGVGGLVLAIVAFLVGKKSK